MKRILLIIAVVLAPYITKAQFNWGHNYFEVGVGGGIMNYSGELTTTIFDFKHVHPAGAIFARYNLGKFLSFRLQFALGSVSGNDADSKDIRKQIRNLNFKSHLFEGALMVEANLMGFQPRGHEKMFSPYVFVGLGIFNFNPWTTHYDPNRDGERVYLRDLNTEGQNSTTFPNRSTYSMTQLSIPMGLGIKYAINSNLTLGFEVGFRPTFTDYLDDVGQSYLVDLGFNPDRNNNIPYYLYDETPITDPTVAAATPYGGLSERELFADKTYAYIAARRGQSLDEYLRALIPVLIKAKADPATITDQNEMLLYEEYSSYVGQRIGGAKADVRGNEMTDWYVYTQLTISYNFIENGLVGFRKRRKRKAGCKSAQF